MGRGGAGMGKKWEKVVEKGKSGVKWGIKRAVKLAANLGEGGAENVSRHPRATS